ncbi:MAG: metallophosphoesterase [Lentimicrobium sp.]|jgi:hypothetical protein|nr:metallophosphoesterase [Lentimicrobium sp.]
MKKKTFLFVLTLISCLQLFSQTIKVQPYLQDATPTSIFVSWETTSGTESTVEYGLSPSLGMMATGANLTATDGVSKVHEVQLLNLLSSTKYYYRVNTSTAVSAINSFKTPPTAADNATIRILAMSDMQIDNANPNKFNEIINNGVISYLNTNNPGDIADNLNMILAPGDLVASGTTYSQWQTDFFAPAQNIFKNVPVYPVLGNHEINSPNYYNYFHLPTNGAVGYIEHSWYKDISNVRIIGIDSNSPYTNQAQLDWLDATLASAATNPDIDFVITQFHHPSKSELWVPGELAYSSQVVSKLEQFSNTTGKPSVHLFGHTHAYSRGQSRDYKHIWMDVASSGGNIDYWSEYTNKDYDEFSVTTDDYGFVLIEITNDSDPRIVFKRISRGNEITPLDNVLRDTFTIRLNPSAVNTPIAISPDGITLQPQCVTLKANDFSSPNATATHGQSHWQISSSTDFSDPDFESWKNFENWYQNVNTQATDDLTDEKINNLIGGKNYWWRVRYRDKEFNWSNWSDPLSFTTSVSGVSANLLLNPGAENGLTGWTTLEGSVEALTNGQCGGIAPHSGLKYFAVGGICVDTAVGRCSQTINVSSYATSIDGGNLQANFGGYLRDWEGLDVPQFRIVFLNESGIEIGSSNWLSTINTSWTELTQWVSIPVLTRMITFELKGIRNNGSDNDSYIDDLFLTIGTQPVDCNLSLEEFSKGKIKFYPNPWTISSTFEFSNEINSDTKLLVTNILGQRVSNVLYSYETNRIVLKRGNLKPGVYIYQLIKNNVEIGTGKFIVE